MRLADHTTSRVGGPAEHWVTATSEAAAISAIRLADESGSPLLVLGGGSNTLMADAGFPGTVVQLAFTGVEQRSAVTVRMAAGQDWDRAVAWTVDHGLSGLEALSGIPGSAGARTPWSGSTWSSPKPPSASMPATRPRGSSCAKSSSLSRRRFSRRSRVRRS